MVTRYKVGDQVCVKSEATIRPHGNWNSSMDKWCGSIMTIKSIHGIGYRMEEDGGEWYWENEFVEDVYRTFEDTTPPSEKSGLKIGDTVKIRQWNDMAKEFKVDHHCDIDLGPIYFVHTMKNLCGKYFEITAIFDERIDLNGDASRYAWCKEAFEPTDKAHDFSVSKPGYKYKAEQDIIKIKPQKGETQIMNVLERMASTGLNKEIEAAGASGLPQNILESLQEQLAEEAKTASKDAARQIMSLYKKHDELVERRVKQVRALRAQIDAELSALEKLNTAKAYGGETSNFVPLAILVGSMSETSLEDRSLAKVPDTYKVAKAKK